MSRVPVIPRPKLTTPRELTPPRQITRPLGGASPPQPGQSHHRAGHLTARRLHHFIARPGQGYASGYPAPDLGGA
ncbi:MAG TPA: hypothetical protein VJ482_05615, partial [Acidimicrobiia bacterium]|nr:hypothetical protein [Acidimicrobiia bacterium]